MWEPSGPDTSFTSTRSSVTTNYPVCRPRRWRPQLRSSRMRRQRSRQGSLSRPHIGMCGRRGAGPVDRLSPTGVAPRCSHPPPPAPSMQLTTSCPRSSGVGSVALGVDDDTISPGQELMANGLPLSPARDPGTTAHVCDALLVERARGLGLDRLHGDRRACRSRKLRKLRRGWHE